MSNRFRLSMWTALTLVCLTGLWQAQAVGAPRTWIGGNVDWVDGSGDDANWSPADEPDPDDEAIFNLANSVSLGSDNEIMALTLSGGIDLSLNGNNLTVDGLVQLSGLSTNLIIDGSRSSVNADNVTINGGAVELSGGALYIDDELSAGVLTIAAGGTLSGHGIVNLVDFPFVVSSLLNNNGTLTASTRSTVIGFPPAVGTLAINAGGGLTRINLDGSGEAGEVNVNRNQTLDINVALSDVFNGSINLFHDATLDIAAAWTLGAGGTITVDNGAIIGLPGIAAGVSTITGGLLTQTGGTLTVVDNDGTLQLDAPFTMTGGTFLNTGLVILNADASISVADFDFDAGDWIVGNSAHLTLNVTDYDPGVANNSFDAALTLDNGDISVTTGDAEFVMNGTLEMISTQAGLVTLWSGEPVDIGNDVGAPTANLSVMGSQVSRFSSQVDFNSDANVTIAAGAILDFNNTVNFDTVNAANQGLFSGAGTVRFNNTVNVNEAVTLDMPGGTVDLDGTDTVGDTISIQAGLVINAATLAPFGRSNAGGGVNRLQVDALSFGATGSLTVQLDDPNAEWTLNPQGELNIFSTNALLTLLHGSDANLNGAVNVTGTAGTAARIDIGGTVNLVTPVPSGAMLLQGGSLADPNTIAGGTINGPGELQALTSRALVGFGTINAAIDFGGSALLRADDGELTLNGAIFDVGQISASDDGVLNVANAWNSSVASQVTLLGGELTGGTVTVGNASGIMGWGLVSSRIINNTQVSQSNVTETLVLQTAANDNDWDGAGNAGSLIADGGTLELHDNATFDFGGVISAINGGSTLLSNFDFTFNPGATLHLDGGTLQSTNTVHIEGAVLVDAGVDSTIDIQVNRFLDFEATSTTALDGNLRLVSNNATIDAGATFSGTGALIIPMASHLVVDATAEIDVLLDVQGTFYPSGFHTVGRVDLRDYQQADTGNLVVEIIGTGLNQFDRLVVNGDVLLDGLLDVDFDGGFVPQAGDTFNIISANSVSGTFEEIQSPGLPVGLFLDVNYLLNSVQIAVAESPPGDFDGDGDVDGNDWAIFSECITGPDVPGPPMGCSPEHFALCDIDADNDVDLLDFGSIQGCSSGDGVPADPACAD